jgi:hypothetical protein
MEILYNDQNKLKNIWSKLTTIFSLSIRQREERTKKKLMLHIQMIKESEKTKLEIADMLGTNWTN